MKLLSTMKNTLTKQRLESLDILRGFDLFLLVFFQPVFVAWAQQLDVNLLHGVLYQFDHEAWVGFRAWDLVMPLFLFMTGAAMPFSFEKYRLSSRKAPIYRRIFRRVLLLFLLGMVVQGNLLTFDVLSIRFYTNTLQAIAVGYLIAAIIQLHCSFKGQLMAVSVLLLLYWIPMTFCGDFTPTGNFAEQVDRLVLGCLRDGAYWNADGTWSFSEEYTYTWVWSSLTFGVTVMMGVFAGQIMKNGSNKRKNARLLFFIGMICLLAALAWSYQMPIIKRIWSCSMTLFSGGCCYLLMALFYYLIDCKEWTYGLKWLKVYGMNSITAYVLGEVINFRSIPDSLLFGMKPWLGTYYPVLLTFCNFLILFFILRILYKQRIFLKV